MADTTSLKKGIERHVRVWLGSQFPGHHFQARSLLLRSGKTFDFDAVSDDGSIMASILSNRPKTRTGNENTGAVRKALLDICYLLSVPGDPTRLMVFTDTAFRDLVALRDRLGDGSIRMEVCPLPSDLATVRQAVLDDASREQRAAGDEA